MRIAVLTQYYPPETGAPQRRLSHLVRCLRHSGHTVTVLTAMPNYPTGRIFQGFGGILRIEEQDGVRVIRTWILPTQKTSVMPRLLSYFSFVIASAIAGSIHLGSIDYLLVESPPLFMGLSGYLLSRLKRARLIFNVSDLWPESAVRLGVIKQGGLFHRLSTALERFCYCKAFLVTGQSRGIVTSIQLRFPKLMLYHLSNGVDVTQFGHIGVGREIRDEIASSSDACVVLYAGLHGIAQGLDQILNVAEQLRDTPHVCFVLVGDGPEKSKLLLQAKKMNLMNVRFVDVQPMDKIAAFLDASDIILVSLKMDILGAVPSKLYEAMASRRPVMLIAEGEAGDIIREHDAGLVVPPGDLVNLRSALMQLASQVDLRVQLGKNGRVAAETEFDRTVIAQRFITFLESQLDATGRINNESKKLRTDKEG